MSSSRAALVALFWAGAAVIATAAPVRADTVGIVRGTVRGADSKPVAGVPVALAGERFSATQKTGADGRFAFVRVPFGTYTLSAANSAGSARATIDVASNGVVDIPLLILPTIGRSSATSTSVRGTPVSENVIGASQIGALPANSSVSRIIETLPGIVRFSYDEPVAHGFHGLTYEIDGAPLPASTSSNFANLIDPRAAGAIEVFTGAFPAEFGGSRQGAVVNVQSLPFQHPPGFGTLVLGSGELGTDETSLTKRFDIGKAEVALSVDNQRSDRGLDTPTLDALHDATSTANQFLRIALPMSDRDLLAVDVANQYATYQIPINTSPDDPNAPQVSLPRQDDVQREYDQFTALSYTHTSADGQGYLRIVPWARYNRVVYDGDLGADVQAYLSNGPGQPVTPLNGLSQDRSAAYTGLRLSAGRTSDRHALSVGFEASQEAFRSNLLIAFPDGSPNFVDNASQRGSQLGAYIEDVWSVSPSLAIKPGLRWDRSTGYTSGSQLSPRFEIDDKLNDTTILHAYIGRLYAAPSLEDTRRDAVITDTSPTAAPVYDLKPERDTYLEIGLAHTFQPGLRGYINAFDRTAVNVLDTTQLNNTPLFAVFNNAIGVARGVEGRMVESSATTDVGASLTYSRALAGGISGGTFLFPPGSATDLTLQPEDHDQTWNGDVYVTRHFSPDRLAFATLETQYGTGFPVQFQNGDGRLPAHFEVNAAVGRGPSRHGLGYEVALDNLLDHRYLIKVSNGFNTTQWNAPRRIVFRLTAPW